MFAPAFAISHGVRPISPGRSTRNARSAPGSAQRNILGVLFRKRSIFIRFSITFSFAQDTVLLPCITDLRQSFIFLKGNSGRTYIISTDRPKSK